MEHKLQHYTLTLTVEGPVHIGGGKSIGKKEYIYNSQKNRVHIPNLPKMLEFFSKNKLSSSFENYLLYDRGDLAGWLGKNRVTPQQYQPWIAYELDAGDTQLERLSKKEILVFQKDPYGNPYVPGSSLKGALRTMLLGAILLSNQGRLQGHQSAVLGANLRPGNKNNLQSERNKLEQSAFCRLKQNKEQPQDAVNDQLRGLRVGDSEPLETCDLVLCQKIDLTRDGTANPLPILRECLRPGVKIRFPLTIDANYCPYTPQSLLAAAKAFSQFYDQCFLNKFPRSSFRGGGIMYLGGGCGYVSKTVTYPLLGTGRQAIDRVSKIINASLSQKTAMRHKHERDTATGVSPHMLKCTRFNGQLYEMGACSMTIQ